MDEPEEPAPKEPVPDEAASDEADVDTVTDAVLAASRLLVAIAARSLCTVEHRLTLPQFRMLVVLSALGPAKLVDLAEHLDVQPSTALRMVDRLVAARLVGRRHNPVNRRETELTLTVSGRRVVREVTARRRAVIGTVLRQLPPARRAALVEALDAFNRAGRDPRADGAGPGPHAPGWSDPVEEAGRSVSRRAPG